MSYVSSDSGPVELLRCGKGLGVKKRGYRPEWRVLVSRICDLLLVEALQGDVTEAG